MLVASCLITYMYKNIHTLLLKNTNVQIKEKWAKNPFGRHVHCDSVLILKKCTDLSLSLTRSLSFYPTPPQQHGLVQGSSNLTSSVVHGNMKSSNVLSFQISLMLGRATFKLFHNQIIKLKVRRRDDTWLWEAQEKMDTNTANTEIVNTLNIWVIHNYIITPKFALILLFCSMWVFCYVCCAGNSHLPILLCVSSVSMTKRVKIICQDHGKNLVPHS